jgi:8-oxo-dGTP pyrophosphatase MutT (NUDIX family)
MDNSDELLYEKRARAGLIPFRTTSKGALKYLMMVSSDAKFGGPRPMISKGKIEEGETTLECAIREAEEELGLKQENLKTRPFLIEDERVTLRSGAYQLTVYAAEIIEKMDFGKWCDETEYTAWMTLEDFREKGRRDHVKYVEQLEARLDPKGRK